MTLKENYLTALKHGMPDSIPYYGAPVRYNVGFIDDFEKGPLGGGYDGYGVRWEFSDGASSPATDVYVLADVTKWREQVTFPDLDAIDWKAKAQKDLARYDPETQVLEYAMGNGPFERLLAWMGYQYLIDALLEEPDACHELIDKWVEERLHFIDLVCEHYHPDAITIYDDVAFERGLFLTMDMYEEFIQPAHTTINARMIEHGVMPIIHCCGKGEDLIENFISEGNIAWTSCQPMNDIASLTKKYHDRITIIGGFNSNGAPGREEATQEERLAEIRRAIDDYAAYGSFIMGNVIFIDSNPEKRMAKIKPCADEIFRYGENWYVRNGLK